MGKTIFGNDDAEYKKRLKDFQAKNNPKPTGAEREKLLLKIQQRDGGRLTPSHHTKEDCCCKGEGHGKNKNCRCKCK